MKSSPTALSLTLGLLLIAGGAQAGTAQHSMTNGRSVHGTPASAQQDSRVVDVTQARTLNVACGQTVVFRRGDQSFAWTFDAVDHRAVKLASIAPPGFADQTLTIYISRNESERT